MQYGTLGYQSPNKNMRLLKYKQRTCNLIIMQAQQYTTLIFLLTLINSLGTYRRLLNNGRFVFILDEHIFHNLEENNLSRNCH